MFRNFLLAVVLCCFVFAASMPAAFAAAENEQLTLDEAVQKALEHNRNLEIQDLKSEKAGEELDDLRKAIRHIPVTGFYIPEASRVWSGYLLARENERITRRQLENMRQQLVVDVTSHYYEALKSTNRVELAQSSLKIAQKQLRQARLKHEVGLLGQAELYGYQAKLAKAESDSVAAQKALAESRTGLALLIGLRGDFEHALVDEAEFAPAEFTSLAAVVAQALSPQNFSVWAAERMAAVTARVAGHADNYRVGLIEAHLKDLEASAAKDKIREKAESLYWSLQALEEAHKALEQQVGAAKEKLRVTKLQNEVGLVTGLHVRQAEHEYNQAVDELGQLVHQHNVAKIQLQVLTGDLREY